MTKRVAGHWFATTPMGYEACVDHGGIKGCGIRWRHVASATPADLYQVGIAHFGGLRENELAEIDEKRRAEQDLAWKAVQGLGPSGIAPGGTDVFDGDGLVAEDQKPHADEPQERAKKTHEEELYDYIYS